LFPGIAAAMSDESNVILTLTEDDIPGASLKEPLEKHNIAALKWWLLCRGIQVSSSSRKMNLIERYNAVYRHRMILIYMHAKHNTYTLSKGYPIQ